MIVINKRTIDITAKVSVIGAILVGLLYFAGHIIFPIVFAGILSLGLLGTVRKLESFGLNRFIAAFIPTFLLTLIVIGVITYFILEGVLLIDDLNILSKKSTVTQLDVYYQKITSLIGVEPQLDKSQLTQLSKNILSYGSELLGALFKGLNSIAVFIGLVPVYVFFILVYRSNFMQFLSSALDKNGKDESSSIGEAAVAMMRKYLVGLFTVILIVATLNSIGLFFIGINHAILIGATTAFLIIIPYIGSIIGALIPTVIALITFDSIYYPIAVLGLYIAVQFIEGYFLSPTIVGKSVDLNPLVILIGMLILGSLGGILALVVAVPLLAIIKIIIEHTDKEKYFKVLLQEQELTSEKSK